MTTDPNLLALNLPSPADGSVDTSTSGAAALSLPEVRFAAPNAVRVLEGQGFLEAPLTLSFATDVTVTVTVQSYSSTSDIVIETGAVTFLPGQTTALFRARIVQDSLYEGDEYFLFQIGGVTNGLRSQAYEHGDFVDRIMGYIADDEVPPPGPFTGSSAADTIVGGSGNDVLAGYFGDDVLSGAAGDDLIDGGPGNDILDGGPGTDTLRGGDGDDLIFASPGGTFSTSEIYDGGFGVDTVDFSRAAAGVEARAADLRIGQGFGGQVTVSIENLIGSSFNDKLAGSNDANILRGREGDDRLAGGEGNDILDGGEGVDTATYEADFEGVRADLQAGVVTGASAGTDRLISIERLVLSYFDDFAQGGDGNDYIDGDNGSDVLRGGSGNDVLFAGGSSELYGEAGDDALASFGGSRLDGGDGDDRLFGGWMTGGAGSDTFRVSSDGKYYEQNGLPVPGVGSTTRVNDFQSGFDKIDLRAVTDAQAIRLFSEPGLTRVIVDLAQPSGQPFVTSTRVDVFGERLQLGDILAGSIPITRPGVALSGGTAADNLVGGVGEDTLAGRGGADTLTGGAGADTFVYAVGDSVAGAADVITDFETGLDRLDLGATSPTATSLVRSGGNTLIFSQGSSGAQTQVLVNGTTIQGGDLLLNGGGIDFLGQDGVADLLIGGGGPDTLFGFSGGDRLEGGAGDDRLFGDAGGDILVGGAGADRFAYRGFADSNATSGYDIVTDFVSGTDKIDLFFLNGLQTVALVRSGGGTFVFANTSGGQVQVGFTGAVQGTDLVNPSGTAGSFGYDLLGEGGNETLVGSAGNDTLFGFAGTDTLQGGAGDDALFGDAGGDILTGGLGVDKFSYRGFADSNAATGYDIVTDFVSGTDKIDLFFLNGLQSVALVRTNGATFLFAATTGGQVQVGFTGAVQGSDVSNPSGTAAAFGYDIVGEAVADTLIGSAGSDKLFGLDGADVLTGGAGADVLTGGAGADIFAYRALSDSSASATDRIADFAVGVDKLDLRGVHLNTSDRYGYATSGADTVLFYDANGDGTNDMQILLSGVTNLTAADILF